MSAAKLSAGMITDAQRDLLWGFLYASSFNRDPAYDRPRLSKDEFASIGAAERRRQNRGRVPREDVESLVALGLVRSAGTGDGRYLITAAGRAALSKRFDPYESSAERSCSVFDSILGPTRGLR